MGSSFSFVPFPAFIIFDFRIRVLPVCMYLYPLSWISIIIQTSKTVELYRRLLPPLDSQYLELMVTLYR